MRAGEQGRIPETGILREGKANCERAIGKVGGEPEELLHSPCALLWRSEFLSQNKYPFPVFSLQAPPSLTNLDP